MKVPLHWLVSYLNGQDLPLQNLIRQMPLAGFEIESVEKKADDVILDFAITPNRGDCLSVRGLAREIACLNNLPFEENLISVKTGTHFKIESKLDSHFRRDDGSYVKISAPAACPLYVARIIQNIPKNIKTPEWIKDRIIKSGLESIHPIVDIANYVMLELGQPIHAFDADKIRSLEVRFAKNKETIEVLGGQRLMLAKNTLVIADDHGVQAVAGVIGGLRASVSDQTVNIFLESAHFSPQVIAGRARQYGLQTEAAQRFERGVDPALPLVALEYVTQLIVQHLGGGAGEISITKGDALPTPKSIELREDRIQRILGCEFFSEEMQRILTALGMKLESSSALYNNFFVTPPTFRFDIATEIDLIEELARIRGYETIPTHMPRIEQLAPEQNQINHFQKIRETLVQRGYREIISYSFIGERLQQQCFPGEEVVKLKNPLSSEFAIMRTSLWPSLLSTWKYNVNHQQTRARIFEIGRVYFPNYLEKEQHLDQPMMLAGLIAGTVLPEQWSVTSTHVDFFDLKGDVETLLKLLGLSVDFVHSEHSVLHPGQSADIFHERKMMGSLGRLHPSLQQSFDLGEPVYLFELMLDKILFSSEMRFEEISKFPSVRRDFAFLVTQTQPVGEILEFVKSKLGMVCQEVILFDIYQGKNISSTQKSIAFGVIFQALEVTWSDEKVNAISEDLIHALQKRFGMILRE